MERITYARIGLLFASIALALTLVGCAGLGTMPSSRPAASLAVENRSRESICYVQFSPTTDTNWGPDRLARDEVIAPGVTRAWAVPAGTYDVRLLDCDQSPMMERRQVGVDGPGTVVTFRTRERARHPSAGR